MLDYAFAQYEVETLLSKDSIISTEKIERSIDKYVEIVPVEDVNVLNKKASAKKTATYELKINDLKVPVEAGDIVGTLVVDDGNTKRNINVTVKKSVYKANILELFLKNLSEILTGNIGFN